MKELGFVHRFVPATRRNTPTLLLLHGTGGDERDLIPLGETLLPGAALLSPRGKVLENGMPRFFRRLAEGVFDLPDLRHRTRELSDFIAGARHEYQIAGQILAVGYSNGANIAASLMLLYPGVLSGAVLFRAMIPFVPDALPQLKGTKILLLAGLRDAIVPRDQPARLADIFERAGATVSLQWDDGGHELSPNDFAVANRWLNHLNEKDTP